MTDVGDGSSLCQFVDIQDQFEMLMTDSLQWKCLRNESKGNQHNHSATNITVTIIKSEKCHQKPLRNDR